MQVRNVLIDTHAGYANKPTFIVVVDKLPAHAELVYDKRDGLYFAYNNDGYVNFFSYSGPGTGYGGTEFPLRMQYGSMDFLVGPWSSRAGVMNKAGFPTCVDVTFQSHEGKQHGHILADTLSMHADMKKVETEDGEYTFEPTIS